MADMKSSYAFVVTFPYCDGTDSSVVLVDVPKDIGKEDVIEAIRKAHDYLDQGGQDRLYDNEGRTARSLMEYIHKRHGWDWEPFAPAAEIVLD